KPAGLKQGGLPTVISVPLTAQQRFAASQDLNPGSPETSSETGGNPGEGDTHGSGNQPAPTPPAKDGKPADAKRPESAQLLINVMGGALILEFIHQVFSRSEEHTSELQSRFD